MDLTASWTGDLGVQFHLFFVLVGHPFQEGCQRGTAVLAEVVSVLVGHSCSLRVDGKPGSVQHPERGVDKPLDYRNQAHSAQNPSSEVDASKRAIRHYGWSPTVVRRLPHRIRSRRRRATLPKEAQLSLWNGELGIAANYEQVPISVANNSLTIALQSYEPDVVASTKREEVTLRLRQ